jgi:hypothetical protein
MSDYEEQHFNGVLHTTLAVLEFAPGNNGVRRGQVLVDPTPL